MLFVHLNSAKNKNCDRKMHLINHLQPSSFLHQTLKQYSWYMAYMQSLYYNKHQYIKRMNILNIDNVYTPNLRIQIQYAINRCLHNFGVVS